MISDLAYSSKNLYISNQVKFRPIYSLLGFINTDLYIKNFYYFVNIPTFIIRFMALIKLIFV